MDDHNVGVSLNPRPSSDGALLFGGEGLGQPSLHKLVSDHAEMRGDDRLGNFGPITQAVQSLAYSQFAGWPSDPSGFAIGEGFDFSWSGIIGNTVDGLPYIGRVPDLPGQFVIAGFNGHGMARIFGSAPELARMVTNRELEYEDTNLPRSFKMTKERMEKGSRK